MGSAMSSTVFNLQADGAAYLRLDPGTVRVLVDEARARKKTPAALAAAMMRDALEDAIDLRDAKRVMERVKSGKEKTVSAVHVFRRNGLAT